MITFHFPEVGVTLPDNYHITFTKMFSIKVGPEMQTVTALFISISIQRIGYNTQHVQHTIKKVHFQNVVGHLPDILFARFMAGMCQTFSIRYHGNRETTHFKDRYSFIKSLQTPGIISSNFVNVIS